MIHMSRNPARNSSREQIAHLAARLMAEDGIEDYALAKRKAARQAGMPDSKQLPDNDEIDIALTAYRELFKQHHPEQLRDLRERALELMTALAQFAPYLTGSVLSGAAGQYADIQLQLFVESPKMVELALLNKGIRYETAAVRLFAGDMPIDAAVLSFESNAVTVHLTLLSPRELRSRIKSSFNGRAIERADRAALEKLLARKGS
jgi:hypothetical protein